MKRKSGFEIETQKCKASARHPTPGTRKAKTLFYNTMNPKLLCNQNDYDQKNQKCEFRFEVFYLLHKPTSKKEKAPFFRTVLLWQPEKDSNPHKQSQSLLCYLYTIPLRA